MGAQWADSGGENRGAAYVFERNQGGADNWGEVAILAAEMPSTRITWGPVWPLTATSLPPQQRPVTPRAWCIFFDRNEGGADNWGRWPSSPPPTAPSFKWGSGFGRNFGAWGIK